MSLPLQQRGGVRFEATSTHEGRLHTWARGGTKHPSPLPEADALTRETDTEVYLYRNAKAAALRCYVNSDERAAPFGSEGWAEGWRENRTL